MSDWMKIWSWTFMIKEIMRQTYFRKYLGNGRVTSQIEMGTISSINEAEEETRLWEPFGPSWFNLIHKKASTGLGVCILPPKGDQTVGTFLVVKLFSDSEDKSKYYISADQNPLIGNAVHKNWVTYLKIAETNTTGWLRETVNCNLSLTDVDVSKGPGEKIPAFQGCAKVVCFPAWLGHSALKGRVLTF